MDDRHNADLIAWLESDEADSRPYRAERLRTLVDTVKLPEAGVMHWGGATSLYALTELRIAYIHGLYLSTVLLALTFIEQELAGVLHASGWDKAASARLETLLTESLARGFLNETESEGFHRLRVVRNACAHYRIIADPMSSTQRSVAEEIPNEFLLEKDAVRALRSVASYIGRR